MADLLECVLQVKGLHETVERLRTLAGNTAAEQWDGRPGEGPGARELLARLAELELVHGAGLRLILCAPGAVLPAVNEEALLELARLRQWTTGEAFDRFAARRRDNLDILDRCSAADFARHGVHPTRRETSIADLVALMLAADAEHVGDIRRALRR